MHKAGQTQWRICALIVLSLKCVLGFRGLMMPEGELLRATAPFHSCSDRKQRLNAHKMHVSSLRQKNVGTIPSNLQIDKSRKVLSEVLSNAGLRPSKDSWFQQVRFENEGSTLRIESWGDNDFSIYQTNRPTLLWLPDVDGTALSAAAQFRDLSTTFELNILTMSGDDKTSFDGIVDFCIEFLESRQRTSEDRHMGAIIGGESVGALFALSIGLKKPQLVQGLVLVNPATSVPTTNWPFFANSLRYLTNISQLTTTKLSATHGRFTHSAEKNSMIEMMYGVAGMSTIMACALDTKQKLNFANAGTSRLGKLSSGALGASTISESLSLAEDARKLLDSLMDIMPPEALWHRLNNQVAVGVRTLNPRLKEVQVPVLVVAGADDVVLPSGDEAGRLQRTLPICTVVRVAGAGHIPLDARVNLTAMIIDSPVAPRRMRKDPVLDFVPPSAAMVRNFTRRLSLIRRWTSPVFFSTLEGGRIVRGLDGLPRPVGAATKSFENTLGVNGCSERQRPVLYVGNHQLLAADLAVLIGGVLEETGILMRGLAHPALFRGGGIGGSAVPGLLPAERGDEDDDLFRTFGAVPVSPAAAHKLLGAGETVLLFPGGVREALHGPGEAYRLFWPDRPDFVRLAARFNATIVPFGSIGAADSFRFLGDTGLDHVIKSAVRGVVSGLIGSDVSGGSSSTGKGRWGSHGLNEERLALPIPPAVAPLPPWEASRFYYLFGEPIDTGLVDPDDPVACARLYAKARTAVEECIRVLLAGRARDPYSDGRRRLVYEALKGQQAPTFNCN